MPAPLDASRKQCRHAVACRYPQKAQASVSPSQHPAMEVGRPWACNLTTSSEGVTPARPSVPQAGPTPERSWTTQGGLSLGREVRLGQGCGVEFSVQTVFKLTAVRCVCTTAPMWRSEAACRSQPSTTPVPGVALRLVCWRAPLSEELSYRLWASF